MDCPSSTLHLDGTVTASADTSPDYTARKEPLLNLNGLVKCHMRSDVAQCGQHQLPSGSAAVTSIIYRSMQTAASARSAEATRGIGPGAYSSDRCDELIVSFFPTSEGLRHGDACTFLKQCFNYILGSLAAHGHAVCGEKRL